MWLETRGGVACRCAFAGALPCQSPHNKCYTDALGLVQQSFGTVPPDEQYAIFFLVVLSTLARVAVAPHLAGGVCGYQTAVGMMPRRPVALLLSAACASALLAPQPRLTRVAPLQSEPGPQPPAPEPEKPRPEPRPVIMPTVTGANGEQIDVVSRLLKDRILLLGSEAVP